jgi:hypothetical protein
MSTGTSLYPIASSDVFTTNDELGSTAKKEVLHFFKTLSPNVPPFGVGGESILFSVRFSQILT